MVFGPQQMPPQGAGALIGKLLGGGVIFDTTVIRVLLVPVTMQLRGGWNWLSPRSVARILRVAPNEA